MHTTISRLLIGRRLILYWGRRRRLVRIHSLTTPVCVLTGRTTRRGMVGLVRLSLGLITRVTVSLDIRAFAPTLALLIAPVPVLGGEASLTLLALGSTCGFCILARPVAGEVASFCFSMLFFLPLPSFTLLVVRVLRALPVVTVRGLVAPATPVTRARARVVRVHERQLAIYGFLAKMMGPLEMKTSRRCSRRTLRWTVDGTGTGTGTEDVGAGDEMRWGLERDDVDTGDL